MRRCVSIAVLTATLVIGIGTVAIGQKNILTGAQQKPETTEVKIDNFSFGPGTLTIPVGTTVTWTNRDDIPHTVVSTDGVFKSKVLDSPEDDRQNHRAVSEKRPCIPSTSRRRCLRNTRNMWS